jgi:hypothetical protein
MTTASEQPTPSDPQAEQALAWEILETLSEPNTWLVQRVVAEIGVERARHFLAGTLAVEAEGGLLVERGTRRRTPGGVFLYLVRNGVSPAARKRLWPRQRQKGKKRSHKEQATIEPLAWAAREPLVAQATVNTTLGYASNHDLSWHGTFPVSMETDHEAPLLWATGEFELSDSSRGLLSRPAYQRILAEKLAAEMVQALGKIYTQGG